MSRCNNIIGCIEAQFHEPTKHADESTLVGRLEANDQKFDLCHRLVWSVDLYPFIFLLNSGQRLDTDRPIEIDLFGRSERLVWATKQSSDRPTKNIRHVDQYPFIFLLNSGQRLDTDRPIEIDSFGRSERLVWATKQSSDRPTKNIRHVKYFDQKPQRPVDLSATLDAQESILVVGSQENIWSASGTVISESQ